uniref:VVA0879 family protein n=1 Tax=Streptococcus pluranimalium TaxID=82348 RepID=UPI003F68C0B3
MLEQTITDWKKEGIKHFGTSIYDQKFKCPNCGRVNSVREFVAFDKGPNEAATECLGRYDDEKGCNWAAYGLFGTMGKGRVVVLANGATIEVFDYSTRRR